MQAIPFIARYRKEQHGGMDTTRQAERLQYLRHLAQRREEVKKAVAEQEKLTAELEAALDAAMTLAEIEDLYRPYRPKRRTRARRLPGRRAWRRLPRGCCSKICRTRRRRLGSRVLRRGKRRRDAGRRPAGASDILAEQLTDDAALRKQLRSYLLQHGALEGLMEGSTGLIMNFPSRYRSWRAIRSWR